MQTAEEQTNFGTTQKAPVISAVLFDYGQVLSLGPNPDAWERMRSVLGAGEEQFSAAYWAPRHGYDRGDLNGSQYWQDVARRAGRPELSETDLSQLYEADVALWTDLNEPMLLWANELHRRDVRTGILSNIGDRMETGIREKFDWIEHFHHCTWSHQLRLAKPERAIYQHAAEGLGTAPENVLFIDDRSDNVEGARAAGMIAIQYTTHVAFMEEMRRLGLEELL